MKIWILCAEPRTVSNCVKLLITWFKEPFAKVHLGQLMCVGGSNLLLCLLPAPL